MLRVIRGQNKQPAGNVVDFQKAAAKRKLKLVKESTDVPKQKQPPKPAK